LLLFFGDLALLCCALCTRVDIAVGGARCACAVGFALAVVLAIAIAGAGGCGATAGGVPLSCWPTAARRASATGEHPSQYEKLSSQLVRARTELPGMSDVSCCRKHVWCIFRWHALVLQSRTGCQTEPLWETYTRTSVEWHALPGRPQGAFSRFSRLFFFFELPRRFPAVQ
jgi:hypothetical protein